jgi:hypothetical protein
VSRPANPTWTTIAFATDVNYSAGALPWQGLPTKVVPAGMTTGFTPKSGVAAQSANYLWNYCTDRIAQITAQESATLDFVGQMPALNLNAIVLAGTWRHAVWNPYYRAWFLVGGAADGRWSYDGGWTWSATAQFGAGGPTTETVVHADTDALGNMVVATLTRYAGAYIAYNSSNPATSNIWSKPDVHGSANTYTWARSFFSPVTSKWTIFAVGTTPSIKTSTDRATWTAGSLPVNWTGTGGAGTYGWGPALPAADINKVSGRIVGAVNFGATGGSRVSTSDDGGVTWTARQDFNPSTTGLSGNAPNYVTMFWDSYTGGWLYVATYTTSGAGAIARSVIYRSTDDGVTFTVIATLTTGAIFSLARLGSLLVANAFTNTPAVSGKNETLVSKDGGVTWFGAGVATVSLLTVIGQAPGQILFPDSGFVRAGLRSGMPAGAVT